MFGGFYFGEMYFAEGVLFSAGSGPPPPSVYIYSNVLGPVTTTTVDQQADLVGSIPIFNTAPVPITAGSAGLGSGAPGQVRVGG